MNISSNQAETRQEYWDRLEREAAEREAAERVYQTERSSAKREWEKRIFGQ